VYPVGHNNYRLHTEGEEFHTEVCNIATCTMSLKCMNISGNCSYYYDSLNGPIRFVCMNCMYNMYTAGQYIANSLRARTVNNSLIPRHSFQIGKVPPVSYANSTAYVMDREGHKHVMLIYNNEGPLIIIPAGSC
jgi:hypothetical protein